MSTFEQRFKEVRLSKGLSQAEMAELLGYQAGSSIISMIETGKRSIPLERMKEIAKILAVDPVWLMGWDDDKQQAQTETINRQARRLSRFFDSLNDVGQKKAIEYIKDLAENPKYRK